MPTFNPVTEALILEVVADPITERDPGFVDHIRRTFALQASNESLRNAPEKVIMAFNDTFANMSKRMQDLWRELGPWKGLRAVADSHEFAFSPTILLAMDRCACLMKHLPPGLVMPESSVDLLVRTPLHLACEDPVFDSFECFDNCQDSFLEARDEFHWTACHVAASSGHLHALRYLHSRGADLQMLDIWGRSVLMLASAHGHTKVVEFLLDKGCDVDARGLNQPRPVFFAVKYKHMETAYLLLKRGARISHSSDALSLLHEIRAQEGLELLYDFASKQDSEERKVNSDEASQAVVPPLPSFMAPRDASGMQADGRWEPLLNHGNEPSRLPTRSISLPPPRPPYDSTARVHSNLQRTTLSQMETSKEHTSDPPSSSEGQQMYQEQEPMDGSSDSYGHYFDFGSLSDDDFASIPNLGWSGGLQAIEYSQQPP